MALALGQAGHLHDWFCQHEPSLLQSTTWRPYTPHATILKVRCFGRHREAHGLLSPGNRVLEILRPAASLVMDPRCRSALASSSTLANDQDLKNNAEDDYIEGEIIVYRGRCDPSQQRPAIRKEYDHNTKRDELQGRSCQKKSRKNDSNQAVDVERYFGVQTIYNFELLAMQGSEDVDERGLRGYPVYGRVYLDGRCGAAVDAFSVGLHANAKHRSTSYLCYPIRKHEHLEREWAGPEARRSPRSTETEWNSWLASIPLEHSACFYWAVLGSRQAF